MQARVSVSEIERQGLNRKLERARTDVQKLDRQLSAIAVGNVRQWQQTRCACVCVCVCVLMSMCEHVCE